MMNAIVARSCCCDTTPTPASACADLVAGSPPAACNWWPDEFDVTITGPVSRYIDRFFAGTNSSYRYCSNNAPVPAQTMIACTDIEVTWSLQTTIYRMDSDNLNAPGFTGIDPPSNVYCPDEPCSIPWGPGAHLAFDACASQYPSRYRSPCCDGQIAMLTGEAIRTTTVYEQVRFFSQSSGCISTIGTATDAVQFSLPVWVIGECVEAPKIGASFYLGMTAANLASFSPGPRIVFPSAPSNLSLNTVGAVPMIRVGGFNGAEKSLYMLGSPLDVTAPGVIPTAYGEGLPVSCGSLSCLPFGQTPGQVYVDWWPVDATYFNLEFSCSTAPEATLVAGP
jgi:hypothetical protein